jgi:translocation and assembly module TamA
VRIAGSRMWQPGADLPRRPTRPSVARRTSGGFVLVLLLLRPAIAWAAAAIPRVAEIRFAGNHTFGDRALLRWMALRAPGFPVHTDFSSSELLSDLERLRRFYRGEGFLAVHLDATIETVERGEGVRLDIRVDEGPRWNLTGCELSLDGAEATPTLGDSLLRGLEVSRPGPYRPRALVTDRDRLERQLTAGGLLDARVLPLVSRDDSCRLVRLRWSVDTGPRARYAGARVYGLERVRESVVTREVAVRPGRLLRPTDIELTRQNLLRTGLFSAAAVISAPRDSGLADKHLVILVRERSGGSMGAGIGYGTSDHARMLASFEHRNLGGRGQRFSIRGVYGERRRGGEAEFVFPWLLGRRLALALSAGHERNSPPAWTAETTRGSLHLVRQVGPSTRTDLGYRLERQQLIKVRAQSGSPGRTRVGTFSLGVIRDTRDDLRRPRSGSYLRLEQAWSAPWLGSLRHFARTDLERVRHSTFGPLAFSFRTHLGWIAPQSSGSSAPLTERYFAGGQGTVRGFPEEAIGPLDVNGLPMGGRILATATVEGRLELVWKLGAIGFVDAGDVVDRARALALRRVSVGAGAGLLVDSPVGRVRAYLAFPLTAHFADGVQVNVATGAAF